MTAGSYSSPPRPAGRQRDPALDIVIRDTTLQLLGEVGLEGCVLTEVARRAGIGKASIYRRWPTKEKLICDVLQGPPPQLVKHEERGPLRAEVEILLHTITAELNSIRSLAWRRVVPSLPPELRLNMGLPASPVGDWQAAVQIILVRARRRGDVASDHLPILEVALHACYATLFERWLALVEDPSAPRHHLADQLLQALLDPHLGKDSHQPISQSAAHTLQVR